MERKIFNRLFVTDCHVLSLPYSFHFVKALTLYMVKFQASTLVKVVFCIPVFREKGFVPEKCTYN